MGLSFNFQLHVNGCLTKALSDSQYQGQILHLFHKQVRGNFKGESSC